MDRPLIRLDSLGAVGSSLRAEQAQQCFEAIKASHPEAEVIPVPSQGYCSHTFLVNQPAGLGNASHTRHILQFRPNKFALDLAITNAAKQVYGPYAPTTVDVTHLFDSKWIGSSPNLRVYQMEMIGGVSYDSVAPRHVIINDEEFRRQSVLVQGFAAFMARAWWTDQTKTTASTGLVGAKLPQKLEDLAARLPSAHLCDAVKHAFDSVDLLDTLPPILSHGDIVPSNIMVDSITFELVGLVDWAEAECLPFGICLHGLEYLLGFITIADDEQQSYQYYDRAGELRSRFWWQLRLSIPALETERLRKALLLAKKIGTLLWHGFAWDDGAIDRVVNEKDDAAEMVYLEAFLSACHDDEYCLKGHRRDSMLN